MPLLAANKNASKSTNQLFKYLTRLPEKESKRVISGQNCGHGDEIVSVYQDHMYALKNITGSWPGMIGVDYEYTQRFKAAQLSACNQILIDYWNHGGLVTINWSPYNPWTDGGTRDLDVGDFAALYHPDSLIYKKWHKQLDRIALGLKELQEAGVVVLWRPMQEMNGSWFWWGQTDNADHYKQIYRDMFTYFTREKALNNLLWVYSTVSKGQANFIKPVDFFYPGDGYVDIVGTNVYKSEDFSIPDYGQYLGFNKPLALTECGPDHIKMDGTFDNTIVIEAIKNKYPEIIYWTTWHDWPDHRVAMVSNQNAKELLEHPWVIKRDDIDWH